MQLDRETTLGLGTLVTLIVVLAFLSIALLTRMGPAVERILRENVYSEEAVEDMLSLLVLTEPGSVPPAFDEALARAVANVTEEAEGPLLETIEDRAEDAFSGDAGAKAATVEALRALGAVNRASMRDSDVSAQRLGLAGAWAAALLGATALALGILVYRRLFERLVVPVQELLRTTRQYRNGNEAVRCGVLQGPYELRQLGEDLNAILDRSWDEPHLEQGNATREAEIRRVVLWFLQRDGERAFVREVGGDPVIGALGIVHADAPERAVEPIPATPFEIVYLDGEAHGSGGEEPEPSPSPLDVAVDEGDEGSPESPTEPTRSGAIDDDTVVDEGPPAGEGSDDEGSDDEDEKSAP